MTTENKFTKRPPIFDMSNEELAETANYKFDNNDEPNYANGKAKVVSDWGAIAEKLRVRPDEEIPPDQVCLSVLSPDGKSSVFGTLGNLSAVIGKAKSRKTFAVSIAVAAAVKRATILRVVGALDDTKRIVLLFDTEQSRYHVLRVVKRICRMIQIPVLDNLYVFALRALNTEDRSAVIEWKIYNTEGVGLVVIDGIRDLVRDINDNTETTEIIDKLMKWSAERNIHIMNVIHMNKGNDQIRGTLGSELQHKAETVVSISLDPDDKEVSIVKPELCRDKDFEPFAFSIDETGLPYVREDWQEGQRSTSRKDKKAEAPAKPPKTITPYSFNEDVHHAILRRGFESLEPDTYDPTLHRIMAAAEYFGYKFGENKGKAFLTHYRDCGWLKKVGTKYVLNLLPLEVQDTPSEQLV
jgi:hypothetical protein